MKDLDVECFTIKALAKRWRLDEIVVINNLVGRNILYGVLQGKKIWPENDSSKRSVICEDYENIHSLNNVSATEVQFNQVRYPDRSIGNFETPVTLPHEKLFCFASDALKTDLEFINKNISLRLNDAAIPISNLIVPVNVQSIEGINQKRIVNNFKNISDQYKDFILGDNPIEGNATTISSTFAFLLYMRFHLTTKESMLEPFFEDIQAVTKNNGVIGEKTLNQLKDLDEGFSRIFFADVNEAINQGKLLINDSETIKSWEGYWNNSHVSAKELFKWILIKNFLPKEHLDSEFFTEIFPASIRAEEIMPIPGTINLKELAEELEVNEDEVLRRSIYSSFGAYIRCEKVEICNINSSEKHIFPKKVCSIRYETLERIFPEKTEQCPTVHKTLKQLMHGDILPTLPGDSIPLMVTEAEARLGITRNKLLEWNDKQSECGKITRADLLFVKDEVSSGFDTKSDTKEPISEKKDSLNQHISIKDWLPNFPDHPDIIADAINCAVSEFVKSNSKLQTNGQLWSVFNNNQVSGFKITIMGINKIKVEDEEIEKNSLSRRFNRYKKTKSS